MVKYIRILMFSIDVSKARQMVKYLPTKDKEGK
jgi:hypothetical protein